MSLLIILLVDNIRMANNTTDLVVQFLFNNGKFTIALNWLILSDTDYKMFFCCFFLLSMVYFTTECIYLDKIVLYLHVDAMRMINQL